MNIDDAFQNATAALLQCPDRASVRHIMGVLRERLSATLANGVIDAAATAEKCGAEVGRYEGAVVWVKFHSLPALESFTKAAQNP